MTNTSEDRRSVMVGVDGSDGSRQALLWALHKMDRLGPVQPVVASRTGFGTRAERRRGVLRSPQEARERWRLYLDAIEPGLVDVTTVLDSAAGPGLVEASRSASLLVVGSRGRSTAEEILLGSVASYCVEHSQVPVVVVPWLAPTRGPLSAMVVGIDGSAGSEASLRWALQHVDSDGRVIAMGGKPGIVWFPDLSDPTVDPGEMLTRQRVEETVARVQGPSDQGPTIEIVVTEADIKTELAKAAQEADLLVIGSRGHHGARRLFHRSVATSIGHHPRVTTVVVPPMRTGPDEPEALT